MRRSFLKGRLHPIVAAIVALGISSSQAAPVTWVGQALNPFWDLADNWNPGLPGAEDDALLGAFDTNFRSGVVAVGSFTGSGTLTVSGGQLSVTKGSSTGGLTIDSGAALRFAGGNSITHTINAAATSIDGTLSITGDNFLNFTVAHTMGGSGTFQHSFGQVTGANLTLGPDLAVNITDGSHSGAATTTVQGTTTISGTGLRLDGERIFRNEGTATQTGNVDMNSRRSGAAEAGTGSITNAADGIWTSNRATGTNFIFASNQGGGDTGAGATFTNKGTFNKQGAGITDVRVNLVNDGSLNVEVGELEFSSGGALTHNGTLTIANGAVLDLASSNATTHAINTASTTIAGTLSITNDNFLNFTTAHTIGGTGTFQHTFGQVTGANLTLGPDLVVNITDGGHSGAATTTAQGTTTISGTGLRLDGGRIFRNEGTVTQTGNVDMNSRRSGAAEAGNGSVFNATDAVWNSDRALGTNFIFASNQGGGDSGAGATFTNAGTFNKQGAGTTEVRTQLDNTGLIDAQQGTLVFTQGTQGTGTLQTSGGVVRLDADSTTGNLFHNSNTANSLNLGANTITVSTDYDNANFGVGDAFDRRANVGVTGAATPRLLAAGDADQGVSGGGVAGGNTATPTMVIGNVHVGATTFAYNIDNTGTTGPALRGALQTGVNGGNIDDARLSGNGVTAGNWGPVATGESLARDVTITVNTAGVYTPLNGQAVSIVNNFENTRSQVLTISSAAGAAAYNLAEAAAVAPNPVNLANQRVGGTNAGALTIANVAPTGLFTEALNASFGSLTGDALTNGGAVNLLAAGSSDSTAMTVRLDGTTAGAKTGSVQIDFASDGTGSSGLGLTSLPTQTVTVNGSFFNSAVGDTTPTPVVIANQRVGGSTSQVLTVANTAAAGLFSEALNASFGANTGAVTNNAGSVSDLIAGGSDNAAMSAGLDTTTAGAKSGSVTLDYQSDGTGTNGNSGLAAIAAGSQVINVSGNVYNAAVGSTSPSPVVIASQRVGGSASQALTVSNAAAAGLFSEALNASFGANTGDATNNAGSLTDLIAGGSDNAAMSVGIDTTTAGAKSGSVTLDYRSDGTGTNGNSGLAAIAAGAQVVNVSGNVYAPAAAQLNTTAVDFGIVHVGDVVANRNVSVSNAAPVSSLNDVLTGSISGAASPFSSSGTLGTGVAAGDTDAASLQVGIDTSNAGVFNSNASVSFASHNDEMADVDLGNQDVTLTGQVNNFAQAEFAQTGGQGSLSGAGANYTLDFGTLVAGDAGLSAQLAVLNTAVGPADALRGSFDLGTVGVGDNFTLSGFATFADVAAGGSFSGLSISFDSGLIGSVDKLIVLSSAGTNASGFDAALGDIELRLRGTVVAIPEPGTYLMLIAGLMVLVSVRRFQGAR